jgi:hypothetical protein
MLPRSSRECRGGPLPKPARETHKTQSPCKAGAAAGWKQLPAQSATPTDEGHKPKTSQGSTEHPIWQASDSAHKPIKPLQPLLRWLEQDRCQQDTGTQGQLPRDTCCVPTVPAQSCVEHHTAVTTTAGDTHNEQSHTSPTLQQRQDDRLYCTAQRTYCTAPYRTYCTALYCTARTAQCSSTAQYWMAALSS